MDVFKTVDNAQSQRISMGTKQVHNTNEEFNAASTVSMTQKTQPDLFVIGNSA